MTLSGGTIGEFSKKIYEKPKTIKRGKYVRGENVSEMVRTEIRVANGRGKGGGDFSRLSRPTVRSKLREKIYKTEAPYGF